MILYRIRDWDSLFENNRTRELKKLDWLPIPNKQDGDGYTLIMEQPDGAAIFGAWIACAQIASRCDPRGSLMRDGKKPHDSQSLARMSRVPAGIMQRMLDVVSQPEINWLEHIDLGIGCEIPASWCEIPAKGCLEGKGKKGREGKGNMEIFDFALRVGKLYNRTSTIECWSEMEQRQFSEVFKRPGFRDELIKVESFAISNRYFPQSLMRLLESWDEVLDRASRNGGAHSAPQKESVI